MALASAVPLCWLQADGARCVHVVLRRGNRIGQGEGVIPMVFDVTADQVQGQLDWVRQALEANSEIEGLCANFPPGPTALEMDETVGLDQPDATAQATSSVGPSHPKDRRVRSRAGETDLRAKTYRATYGLLRSQFNLQFTTNHGRLRCSTIGSAP
jgi:hypothetical protein